MTITRRELLKNGLAAGALLGLAPLGLRAAWAAPAQTSRRFVCVILRGALDGLAAVPPLADPDYARLRRELALPRSGAGAALELDGFFGLHPALVNLQQMYRQRELLVMHAAASPYRERSHFDGQDVLESGMTRPHAAQSGWLNRALPLLPAAPRSGGEAGVALGHTVPLVIRGPAAVASWSPSRLPEVDADTAQRLAELYADDALLAPVFAEAQASQAMAQQGGDLDAGAGMGMKGAARGASAYAETVRMAATFLARDDGPGIAVFDTTGWDTHANEGTGTGLLAQRLAALDAALGALRTALAARWSETAVLVVTEFGRTAAVNGTRGTDHGTAAAAFLLGGAVRGGRVLADWPGLSARNLYQGRDLAPTLDLRSVCKSVLHDHLRMPQAALEQTVFPDSAGARYLEGLVA